VIATALLAISIGLVTRSFDPEKVSPHERGSDPFQDTRINFEVWFCLVAIIFIIFDLEVVFLFLFTAVAGRLGAYETGVMAIFVLILSLGLFYEWVCGALEWE
jgi:NADH-quinone oxidoreductase subunit A